MALVPVGTRNRVNPLSVSYIEQPTAPYVTYDHTEMCTDPNCAVCRSQRHGRHHKHHKRHRHHQHRKHKTSFWNSLAPRIESASTVSVHSIELDDRRPRYGSHVSERALVPVDRTERQVVSKTTTRRFTDDEVVRDAWTPNRSNDDEIICCRAYNGCKCPCWCCVILIILFVILIIILIVLLATLL